MKTDKSLMAAVKAIPDRKMGNPGVPWTKEQIAALLYGWTRKPKKDVARLVGHHIQTCREKFRELTAQK